MSGFHWRLLPEGSSNYDYLDHSLSGSGKLHATLFPTKPCGGFFPIKYKTLTWRLLVAYLAYCCSESAGGSGATWIPQCCCRCWSLWSCCQDWESPLLCWESGSSGGSSARAAMQRESITSPSLPADGTLRHLNAAAAQRPRLCPLRCLQIPSEIRDRANAAKFCLFVSSKVNPINMWLSSMLYGAN